MEHLGYILAMHSENGLEIKTVQTSASIADDAEQLEQYIDSTIAELESDGYAAFQISKEELGTIIEMLQEAYNE